MQGNTQLPPLGTGGRVSYEIENIRLLEEIRDLLQRIAEASESLPKVVRENSGGRNRL